MSQANKIMIAGSSELDAAHVPFAEEFGRRLMTETSAMLITGGLKLRTAGARPALDYVVAEAARQALHCGPEALSQRIMTMLPEVRRDDERHERFEIGTVVRVPYADRRTRRYAMVVRSDAVVAVGGADLTREVLDLAYIANKPLIPMPSMGGAANSCWENYRPELIQRLKPSDQELAGLEDRSNLHNGVSACLTILQRVLRPRCFIAMPFEEHPLPGVFENIKSVAETRGYQVVRVDHERFSGNVVEEVWDSIRHCDIAIVDLTGHRPNVYYEMGIAHALNKPTLLLAYNEKGVVPDDIPFDIRVQRILAYGTTQTLRSHLSSQLPLVGAHGQLKTHGGH